MQKKRTIIIVVAVICLIIALGILAFIIKGLERKSDQNAKPAKFTQQKDKEKIEETSLLTFGEVVKQLDTPEKLIGYLNKNFTIEDREGDKAYTPEEFFQKKEGGSQDFAVFSAYVLDRHFYETLVMQYEYITENKTKTNVITILREGNSPKYIIFSPSGFQVIEAGNSFEDIFTNEDKRMNIKIKNYRIILPGETDFAKKEWTKRGEL